MAGDETNKFRVFTLKSDFLWFPYPPCQGNSTFTIQNSLFLCPILHFFLFNTALGTYEDSAAADVVAASSRIHLSKELQQDYPMAFTPSKDQKRREREQKKQDKRLAKEEARAEKLATQQAEEDAAAEDARELTEEELQAKEEADFEAELAAEAAAIDG